MLCGCVAEMGRKVSVLLLFVALTTVRDSLQFSVVNPSSTREILATSDDRTGHNSIPLSTGEDNIDGRPS